MSNYCLLLWFCVIPAVSLPLSGFVLCHFKGSTIIYFGGSVSFQVSPKHFLRWLCLFPGVPLEITVVDTFCTRCPLLLFSLALGPFTCFIAAKYGDLVLSQLFNCCSQGRFHIIPGVQLPSTFVSVSSYVSHYHSLWWLLVPGVLLPFTLLVLCCIVVPFLVIGLFCFVSGSHRHTL